MPRVKIELVEGRSVDQKRTIAKQITDVIVDVLDVSADVVTVRFEEVPAWNMAKAGRLRSDA